MFKFFFGLVAFFACGLAFTQAQPSNITIIQLSIYTDSSCTTLSTTPTNYTTGDCVNDDYQAYYPSSDNSFVYSYWFAGGTIGCPIGNISSIDQIPVGICGGSGSYDGSWSMYTIFTNIVHPSPPTAFPPTNGFTIQTTYLNLTDSTPSKVCGGNDRTVLSAYPTPSTNPCQKYGVGQSAQVFQDTTCSTQVFVYYTDAACANIVKVASRTVAFKTCDGGTKRTCAGTGIPSFPTTLSIGFKQFDNNQCMPNSKTTQIASINGGCSYRTSLTCGMVNSTQMFISRQFSNADCTGTPLQTVYIPADICSLDPLSQNITATCNGSPPGPSIGSSSTGTIISSSGSSSGLNVSSSSTGPDSKSGDLARSVSISSIVIGMILGFVTVNLIELN